MFFSTFLFGQGRVVINELMPWSGCSTTSEFIELLNFGPGPMNIGCYIVTNGKYSVTIPSGTVIQPGQYFVLSGQDVLPSGCGNSDSAVHVQLNWTTCNCTNTTIPTTGDGFLQDGGNANDKVVLLDPNLNVVDAVSANATPSSSVSITTPASITGCPSQTFDLSKMTVSYETIGSSTGKNNSIARFVDGDCGWTKTTAISAGAPNKTGNTSSATYSFSTLSASQCSGTTGSISIGVSAQNVTSLFPMNYTLAYDADNNNLFDGSDRYTYGIDNTPSSIDIDNLAYGRYRITVGSSLGCNLKSYDFSIFNCYGVVLPVKLVSFTYVGIREGRQAFACRLEDAGELKSITLEGEDKGSYHSLASLNGPFRKSELTINAPLSNSQNFRLRMVDLYGKVSYSPVVRISLSMGADRGIWPNPVGNEAMIFMEGSTSAKAAYIIYNASGEMVRRGSLEIRAGNQILSIPTSGLSSGIYYMQLSGPAIQQTFSYKFIK